ncbi:extracellular solute-binding protein [Pseudostreptobacillus hongkongensis]|uniref:extracellular solute-binding protein n=1 Tax=Pseudostreptobacillus hongkongensis TaxID=1162717 RepID=UPI0009E9C15E|nr:extracellular solute-binding protein [Pseudostreptobacillus hongkongensis]
MKRFLFLMVSMLTLLVSCGGSTSDNKSTNELNIYTWTYFVPDKVVKDFEAETGIKVNLSYYDNNDTMIAKLMAGSSEYDIVSPSTDYIPVMVGADLLEKLDKSKLGKTFENMDEKLDLLEISKVYDDGLNYSIPYSYMATGITVNTDMIGKDYVKTPDIFLDTKFKGRMTMLDDGREVLGLALQYLGYESDSKNLDELNKAKAKVQEWAANLAKFDSNAAGKGMASGEFAIVHGYPDVYYEVEGTDANKFEYFAPQGAMMYIDSMAITKTAPNKENAYKFLEFLYRPENFVEVLKVLRNPSIIKGVEENSDVKPIISAEEIRSKAKLPRALDEETKEIQDKIWNEIKLGK